MQRLVEWTAGQDFAMVTQGEPSLLDEVERIVVESHRRWYEAEAKTWSRPSAYQWLHYEDPMPVLRLLEGVQRLRERGAPFDSEAVEKACKTAGKYGFSN